MCHKIKYSFQVSLQNFPFVIFTEKGVGVVEGPRLYEGGVQGFNNKEEVMVLDPCREILSILI